MELKIRSETSQQVDSFLRQATNNNREAWDELSPVTGADSTRWHSRFWVIPMTLKMPCRTGCYLPFAT